MKNIFLILTFLFAGSLVNAFEANNSCSIEPQEVFCAGVASPAFDQGCSVSCDVGHKAKCTPAYGIAFPSPYGNGPCSLTPSFCYCY
jgi:hypothetical protein